MENHEKIEKLKKATPKGKYQKKTEEQEWKDMLDIHEKHGCTVESKKAEDAAVNKNLSEIKKKMTETDFTKPVKWKAANDTKHQDDEEYVWEYVTVNHTTKYVRNKRIPD